MNNNRDRDAKLLAETFHADWDTGPAATFARAAAATARRRRTLRHTFAATAAALAIGAFTLVATRPEPLATSVRVPVAKTAIPQRGYEIISDDELLAQLHDRPLLVVQRAGGKKEFVWLAETEETSAND
ncbi:MAG: hypothetical protein ABIR80_18105 [Opitutaceae bacterium]